MEDLLHNTRDGSRAGFPFKVVAAFLELQELHNKVFPKFREKSFKDRSLSHRSAGGSDPSSKLPVVSVF